VDLKVFISYLFYFSKTICLKKKLDLENEYSNINMEKSVEHSIGDHNESSSAQNSSTETPMPPSSYLILKKKPNEKFTAEGIFDMDLNKLDEEEEEEETEGEELTDLNCMYF